MKLYMKCGLSWCSGRRYPMQPLGHSKNPGARLGLYRSRVSEQADMRRDELPESPVRFEPSFREITQFRGCMANRFKDKRGTE